MNMTDQLYAEDLPYWKTSKTGPDDWLEKAATEIRRSGGTVVGKAVLEQNGKGAVYLGFQIGEDRFDVKWPVLSSKSGDASAALRQAATMLYHDVKSRSVAARVLGARHAYHGYLLLSNGMTAGELTTPELEQRLPKMLAGRHE